MGKRYRKTEDQKPFPLFSRNQDFAEERGLKPKVKMSELEDVLSKLVHLKRIRVTRTGVWGRSLRPREAMGVWDQSPQQLGNFLYFLEKIAILMPLSHILHVFRAI